MKDRYYNGQKKVTKMIYKILHRKLNIEQNESHNNRSELEGWSVSSLLVPLVVLLLLKIRWWIIKGDWTGLLLQKLNISVAICDLKWTKLCVFTFWDPCCDVRYDFRIETMFGSSLPLVVCRSPHVLFTLFLFVCV